MTSIRIVWVSLACVLALPANLVAGTVFTLIDDTSGPLTSLGFFPSINGAGTVGFNGSPGLGTAGVFVGSGGAVSTIAEFQGPGFSSNSVSAPTINDAGSVAFAALSISGTSEIQTVYAGSGGPLTTIADTTSGTFQTFFGIPSINLAGTVAFGAIRSDGSEGIFTGQGGALTTVATTGTMFSSFHLNGGPSLNNAGTVAFTADRGGGLGLGVFASQGGNLTTIALTAPLRGFTVLEGRPGINGAGTVTFLAFTQVNGQLTEGIFTGTGGAPTLVATGNFSGTPAINDSGTVAYHETFSTGGEALFTQAGPGAPANEIIATGDSLFGSTVTGLDLSTFGLNNDGQLAFSAELADGRTVIVRADIDVVPEPSSLWLLGLGVLGSLGLSRALSGHVKQDRCRRPLPPS